VAPPPAPRPPPTSNSSSSWKPFAWLSGNSSGNKGRGSKSSSKMQQPVRLLFNLVMLFFLMRLWPMGGRLGLGESETLVMSVPFSEFVRRVRHDDVSSVSVDGLHISFSLKPGSLTLPGEERGRSWGAPWGLLQLGAAGWRRLCFSGAVAAAAQAFPQQF
jgi:hypothetical protein